MQLPLAEHRGAGSRGEGESLFTAPRRSYQRTLPTGRVSISHVDWTLNPESPLQKPLDSGTARTQAGTPGCPGCKQTLRPRQSPRVKACRARTTKGWKRTVLGAASAWALEKGLERREPGADFPK